MKKFSLLAIAILFISLLGCAPRSHEIREIQGRVVLLEYSVGQYTLGSWEGSGSFPITMLAIRDDANNLHFFGMRYLDLRSVWVGDIVKIHYDNDIAFSFDQKTTVYDENQKIVAIKVIDFLQIKKIQTIKKSVQPTAVGIKLTAFYFLQRAIELHPSL